MKQITIMLVLIFSFSFSQEKTDYELYLILCNNEKTNLVKTIDLDTFTMKTFYLTKIIPSNKPKYNLIVGINGDIKREVIANVVNKGWHSIILDYISHQHKKQKVLKIDIENKFTNVLTDDDLKNAKFHNFLKVLREAKKVYAIDKKDKGNTETEYMAYEVSVKSMSSTD